ncbi:hypothetical protein [Cytobacillus kochii]|uniref:hypothetical protein n=1 Tax=Cytobacillus kochii TaxID=859143 RepID=UPI0025A18BBE|nr:hypothetical protein [Cytobacillus kochii]MDM5208558.1 hypothetical protein [Cytobacillus kochii]
MDAVYANQLIWRYKKWIESGNASLGVNRLVLGIVFLIIAMVSIAEIIFEGFSWKPVVIFVIGLFLIIFLWKRPDK